MGRSRRLSPQTVAVLRALAQAPAEWRYGYELCMQVGLQAGSMYPILIRLADRGLLETAWETDPPPGRPPRHLYRLTGPGRELAATAEASTGGASTAEARGGVTRIDGRPRPGLEGAR